MRFDLYNEMAIKLMNAKRSSKDNKLHKWEA